MHHEVAGHAGAVLVEAAPAVEGDGVKGLFGNRALPGLPVEGRGGEVGQEGVLPCAAGGVAAELELDLEEVADGTLVKEGLRLEEERREETRCEPTWTKFRPDWTAWTMASPSAMVWDMGFSQ